MRRVIVTASASAAAMRASADTVTLTPPHAPPLHCTVLHCSGADYIDKYDRFFFQWWNFLIYDAETHDHWTIVYHTTKYSKAANYSDYARSNAEPGRSAVWRLSQSAGLPDQPAS